MSATDTTPNNTHARISARRFLMGATAGGLMAVVTSTGVACPLVALASVRSTGAMKR